MSIQSEINRIAGAKSDIADAIEDMGGTLSPGASIDDLAAGVRTIPQGTSDYADLTNKPQINSVTLTGNKSLLDIGAYAKPAGGIPDTDIASAATWNAKANAPTALSLTLASGSWTSATPSTQTLSATGVTASNIIVVGFGSGITSAQYSAASAAKLACTAQGAGTITITAFGTKPTENIPLSVVVLS